MSDVDLSGDPILAESRRIIREFEEMEEAQALQQAQAAQYDADDYDEEEYSDSDGGWVEPGQLATQDNYNSDSGYSDQDGDYDQDGYYYQYQNDNSTLAPVYNSPAQPAPHRPAYTQSVYQTPPSRRLEPQPQPRPRSGAQPGQPQPTTSRSQLQPPRAHPRQAFDLQRQSNQVPDPARQSPTLPLPTRSIALPSRPRNQPEGQSVQTSDATSKPPFRLFGPGSSRRVEPAPAPAALPPAGSRSGQPAPAPGPSALPGRAIFNFNKTAKQQSEVSQAVTAPSAPVVEQVAGPSRTTAGLAAAAPVPTQQAQPAPSKPRPSVFRPAGGAEMKSGVVGGTSEVTKGKVVTKVAEDDFDAIGEDDADFYAQVQASVDVYDAAKGGNPKFASLQTQAVHGSGRMVLKPTNALPDAFRSIFNFSVFNRVQSDTFDVAFPPDKQPKDNMVVSAPTGAGKTVIFELAILAELRDSGTSKVIYVCPTRSLCNERVVDWKRKFPPIGINVLEYTGEAVSKNKSERAEIADLAGARLIVTTPEKMDQLTRRDDNHRHVKDVGLVCLDEVHSVSGDVRGPVLEVLVSRLKTITQARFVCVSATIPNSADVAKWIGNRADPHGSARLFNFGEETRPCPLEKVVVGVPKNSNTNDFAFTSTLNFKLYDLIAKHSDGKPALVFVNTRKACQQAADQIRKQYVEALSDTRPQPLPWHQPVESLEAEDKGLNSLLKYGIGFHHAGLGFHDRQLVEHSFTRSILSVVVCTTTLAVGVNLPARLVIVRGTNSWANGRAQAYSELDMLQMIGRAGRPQFDNKGVGVILCAKDDERHFDNLVHSKTLLESKLHKSLVEHLNSEITLHTINNMDEAVAWIGGTFLSVRFAKNKHYYRQIADDQGEGAAEQSPDATLETFISKACTALSEAGVIHEDKDGKLFSTSLGEIMSRWGISFASFKQICALPRGASMRQVLECVTGSEEASQIRWRGGERPAYKKMNANLLYPAKTLNTSQDKVMILLQAALGGFPLAELKVDASNPSMELMTLWPVVVRTAKAIVDIQADRQDGGIKSGLELVRSLQGRAWEGTGIVLRQIRGIGEKASKIFDEAGIQSFDEFIRAEYHRVQVLIQPGISQAKRMITEAKGFPKFGLRLTIEREEIVEGEGVKVYGTVEVWLENAGTVKIDKEARWHCSLLTIRSDNEFIDYRRMPIKALKKDGRQKVVLRATLTKPSNTIVAIAACDDVAGTVAQVRAAPRTSGNDWPEVVFKEDKAEDFGMGGGVDDYDAEAEAELMAAERAALAGHVGAQAGGSAKHGSQPSFTKPVKGGQPSTSGVTGSSVTVPVVASTSQAGFITTAGNSLPPRLADLPASEDEYPEPVKLPNGNYKCNHRCKKQCSHACCIHGLTKPPKPKPKLKTSVDPPPVLVAPSPSPPPPRPTQAQVMHAPVQAARVSVRPPVASTSRVRVPAMRLSDDDDEDLPDLDALFAPEAVAKGKRKRLEAKLATPKRLPKIPKPTINNDMPYEDLKRTVSLRPALIGDLPLEYQAHFLGVLGLDAIPSKEDEESEIEVEDDNPAVKHWADHPRDFSSDDGMQVEQPAPEAGSHLAALMAPSKSKGEAVATSRAREPSSGGAGVKRARSPVETLDLDSLSGSGEEEGARGESELGRPAKSIKVGEGLDRTSDGLKIPPRLVYEPLFPEEGQNVDVDELEDDEAIGTLTGITRSPAPEPPVSPTIASSQPGPSQPQAMQVDNAGAGQEDDQSWIRKLGELDANGNIDWSWLDAQTETDEQERERLAKAAKERETRAAGLEAGRRERAAEEARERKRERKVEEAEEKARRAARELEDELKGAGGSGAGVSGLQAGGGSAEEVARELDPLEELEKWLKEAGMVET